MRRFVRDRVVAALERTRPAIERYITEQLSYPAAALYRFDPAAVQIREVRSMKVAALAPADLPPVRIVVVLTAWLAPAASAIDDRAGPGLLDIDVWLTARGTVEPDGSYNVDPESAVIKAWWRES